MKLVALILVALVAGSCADGGHAVRSTTTTTARATTPTSSSVTTSTTSTTSTTRPSVATTVGRPTTSIAAGPGTYAFPVSSSSATYGHAHHDYPATDIFAPCGSPVVANADGVVQEVSRVDTWDSKVNDGATRGGLFTSVVGDDGVRYYGSHLSEIPSGIEAGTRVHVGQRLGSVGNTGDARGIACHLHFGISPNCGPGDWEVRRGEVYPWPYLDSWRVGGGSSPTAAVRDWNAAHHAC